MANTIEFMHGAVTTAGQGSMDIWVKYRREPNSLELPIHEAVRDQGSGAKETGGMVEVIPSSSFNTGKNWMKRRVAFPDGSYVTFTFRKSAPRGSFAQSMHNLVISPRESAPLQELRVDLPTDSKSSISAVYITGRFDILKPAEIEEKGLYKTPQGANDLATYDLAALNEIISLRIVEKAARPRLKAKTLKVGTKGVTVARIRRPRRINL